METSFEIREEIDPRTVKGNLFLKVMGIIAIILGGITIVLSWSGILSFIISFLSGLTGVFTLIIGILMLIMGILFVKNAKTCEVDKNLSHLIVLLFVFVTLRAICTAIVTISFVMFISTAMNSVGGNNASGIFAGSTIFGVFIGIVLSYVVPFLMLSAMASKRKGVAALKKQRGTVHVSSAQSLNNEFSNSIEDIVDKGVNQLSPNVQEKVTSTVDKIEDFIAPTDKE